MIGNVIQEKRKELGMTQAQLADLLGVSAPAVSRWEQNQCFPDVVLLPPLARCLKTDLNELFSFYDSLSDKDRDLIIDHLDDLLLKHKKEEVLAYIEKVSKENLSDGKLHLEIAKSLYGFHVFVKVASPTMYLEETARFFERALELLPESEATILPELLSVYGEMGEAEKAEGVWRRLPEDAYSKKWQHAEMKYLLKDYDSAAKSARELVLEDIVDLLLHLNFLSNMLSLSGDNELADCANQKHTSLRELFELDEGFDTISAYSKAFVQNDVDAAVAQTVDLFRKLNSTNVISTCPLFDDESFGDWFFRKRRDEEK